jgi:hypothetical protein
MRRKSSPACAACQVTSVVLKHFLAASSLACILAAIAAGKKVDRRPDLSRLAHFLRHV